MMTADNGGGCTCGRRGSGEQGVVVVGGGGHGHGEGC